MKNNKGFTLIELLVVIVILLSITVIAIPNINASLKRKEQKEKEEDITMLTQYAETYIMNDEQLFECLKEGNRYISLKNFADDKGIKTKTEIGRTGYIVYSSGEIIWRNDVSSSYKPCTY